MVHFHDSKSSQETIKDLPSVQLDIGYYGDYEDEDCHQSSQRPKYFSKRRPFVTESDDDDEENADAEVPAIQKLYALTKTDEAIESSPYEETDLENIKVDTAQHIEKEAEENQNIIEYENLAVEDISSVVLPLSEPTGNEDLNAVISITPNRRRRINNSFTPPPIKRRRCSYDSDCMTSDSSDMMEEIEQSEGEILELEEHDIFTVRHRMAIVRQDMLRCVQQYSEDSVMFNQEYNRLMDELEHLCNILSDIMADVHNSI